MSHKAFQYRIYLDKNQEIWLKHQFGCARFVYNYFLEKHTEIYENTDASMSYTKDNKWWINGKLVIKYSNRNKWHWNNKSKFL